MAAAVGLVKVLVAWSCWRGRCDRGLRQEDERRSTCGIPSVHSVWLFFFKGVLYYGMISFFSQTTISLCSMLLYTTSVFRLRFTVVFWESAKTCHFGILHFVMSQGGLTEN